MVLQKTPPQEQQSTIGSDLIIWSLFLRSTVCPTLGNQTLWTCTGEMSPQSIQPLKPVGLSSRRTIGNEKSTLKRLLHRFPYSGTQLKSNSLQDTQTLYEGDSFTDIIASAGEARTCWDSVLGQRWAPFFNSPDLLVLVQMGAIVDPLL